MPVAKFLLRRRLIAERFIPSIPGVLGLAAAFKRIAGFRVGRTPVGLAALLPVAIVIDLADFLDELIPVVGPILSFVVETAFVLGLTGRPIWSVGVAAFDLIPGIDIVPVATLTVVSMMKKAYEEGEPAADVAAFRPQARVIDV